MLPVTLVGVVLGAAVGLPGRIPSIAEAVTPNSLSFPLFADSRRTESTFVSLTVELNSKAKSTITLPHLGKVDIKKSYEKFLSKGQLRKQQPQSTSYSLHTCNF